MKALKLENVVAGGWHGWFAPKGTLAHVVARIEKAVAQTMKSPALTKDTP